MMINYSLYKLKLIIENLILEKLHLSSIFSLDYDPVGNAIWIWDPCQSIVTLVSNIKIDIFAFPKFNVLGQK